MLVKESSTIKANLQPVYLIASLVLSVLLFLLAVSLIFLSDDPLVSWVNAFIILVLIAALYGYGKVPYITVVAGGKLDTYGLHGKKRVKLEKLVGVKRSWAYGDGPLWLVGRSLGADIELLKLTDSLGHSAYLYLRGLGRGDRQKITQVILSSVARSNIEMTDSAKVLLQI
jgi:hypothetical protein